MTGRVGRRASDGDEGSVLIVGMVVLLLVSTLALAGLARTLSVMNLVRHGQSYDTAHAVADAALQDAVYRLDYGLGNRNGWTVADTELEPGKSYRYKVVPLSADQYRVDAVGTVGATTHAVRAVLKRGAGLVLFSRDPLTIGGSGSSVLGLSLSSVLDVGYSGTPDPVHIGSNGGITVQGGSSGGDVQHTYLDEAGRPAFCSGCTNELRHSRTYPAADVVAPPDATPADKAACDNLALGGGRFVGLIDGRAGRPYLCERDVKVGYFTLVNGPLVIYVLPTVAADGTETHHALDISGAPINLGGRAADLRIYKAGPKPVKLNDLSTPLPTLTVDLFGVALRTPGVLYAGDVSFTGLLYAPETVLRIEANQWWKGAFLAKRIQATGSPLVTVAYDQGLQRFANDWAVTNYAEIPTAEAVVT